VDFTVILGIAIGLAMDAFAVALASGLVLGQVSGRQTFRLSFHFGLFQFLMPVVGWLAGLTIEQWIGSVDHWIAFGLLATIGGKMVWEGFHPEEAATGRTDPTRGLSLVVLSVATSIDALAVGLSLGMLGVRIWYPAIVIGIVTAALTALGMHLGRPLGVRFGHRMEVMGGLILVGIGVRILVAHLAGM
jgi:putative Mn2+ efflux pump MntP